MFDISIKILSLSDAEIYFILASVAGAGHVTGLYRVWTPCVILVMPHSVCQCLHIQQSLIKAPGRWAGSVCMGLYL